MKKIVFATAALWICAFCYADIDRPNALVDKTTGELVGWGWTNFDGYDTAKYDLIQDAGDLNNLAEKELKFIKVEGGKVKEKTVAEKQVIKDAEKATKEAKKQKKKEAKDKLKALGLTESELQALLDE